MLRIFSRARVGLKPPKGAYADRGTLTHVSIHHGGPVGGPRYSFAAAAETWRSWQHYHQINNGWLDIGYHFGVDAFGRLYEGRPVNALPAAVGGHNTGSLGIVFLQDGRYHGLTLLQRRTLRRLFNRGIPSRGIPPLRDLARDPRDGVGVFGHKEYSGHGTNECPGELILDHLRWRRAQ
jgi:hypothetical protein